MTKVDECYSMEASPTEILLYIFSFLSPKQLTKCRQVCSRWKVIVDSLTYNQNLWRIQCQKDFNDVYKSAYYQRMPGSNWFDIYKSLTLWARLDDAVEGSDEFASASSSNDEIRAFQVLRDGIIGVQTRESIKYFDLLTLKESKRNVITGSYLRYSENDDSIVILGYNLSLFVIRKVQSNAQNETENTFNDVKSFILIDNNVYYITLNNEVFLCDLNNEELTSDFLHQTNSCIMSIGYDNGKINLLTFDRDIFTIVSKELIFHCNLDTTSNLLHELKKFNFLENLDWRIYFQWMYILRHTIPQGPLRDIVVIKTYGETVFVGSNWGVLRIYYAPYQNNKFDLFNSTPIKQYNFMERCDCPVLSMCPIIQIDVIEDVDKHVVLVAMPKKIALITFSHHFKTAKSVALLPYREAQSIKFLQNIDSTEQSGFSEM